MAPAVKVRILRGKRISNDVIKTADDSVNVFRKFITKNLIETQECFCAMFLDNSNKVLGVYLASMGGITATVADIRLVMAGALKSGAVAMIICHNHPSGSLRPSVADEKVTKRFSDVGKIMDIKLLDHVILTKEGFYSFAKEGNISIGSVKATLEFGSNQELEKYFTGKRMYKKIMFSKN